MSPTALHDLAPVPCEPPVKTPGYSWHVVERRAERDIWKWDSDCNSWWFANHWSMEGDEAASVGWRYLCPLAIDPWDATAIVEAVNKSGHDNEN